MRSVLLLLLTVATFLLPITPASADLKGADVSSAIKPASFKMGERAELTVTVRHGRDTDVFYPDENTTITPFEILKQKVIRKKTGDISETVVVYTITSFEAGEQEVPTFLVTVKDIYGNERHIGTTRHRVKVEEGNGPGKEIIDILPPMEMQLEMSLIDVAEKYAPYMIIFLVIALSLAIAIHIVGRRSPEMVDYRSEAINKLLAIRSSSEDRRGAYSEIAEIMRWFFGGHLGVGSFQMTSSELIASLNLREKEEELHKDTAELFFDIDVVKFSPFVPTEIQTGEAVSRAEAVIRRMP